MHPRWERISLFVGLALLCAFILQVALSTRRVSTSWDEGDHLYSGFMNWQRGEYFNNPEHPPLAKLVAALPLLPLHLTVPPRQGRYFKDEAYYGGHALIYQNVPPYSADTILFRAHMAIFTFAILLACLVFFAAREMFSPLAALIALTLFVFDATVITNAPFVTTDTAAACGFFAAVYFLYRYAKAPSPARLILVGVVTGLALGVKHSAILALPIEFLLLAYEAWRIRQGVSTTARKPTHLFAVFLVILSIAIAVLWSIYSFRFAMHPTSTSMASLSVEAAALPATQQRTILFLDHWRLLPESYLYGFVDVLAVGNWMPSYVFGKLYAHGLWWYFPAILSLKWSAGVLLSLAIALPALILLGARHRRELVYLSVPPIFYLAVAMASPLNIGVRHVLPVFAFVFCLIGAGAALLIERKRAWAYPIAALLLWHVTDAVRSFPNYLPYANTFWGGAPNTHLYFTDSATNWGQELKFTKHYLDAHHIHDCWYAYFSAPFLLPSDYGIPCKLLPTLDTDGQIQIDVPETIHGPVLVSYPDLNGFEFRSRVLNPYQPLFNRKPDDVIADAVAVYYGDIHLPLASSLRFERESTRLLKTNPSAALNAASQAVTIAPDSYSAHMDRGDALLKLNRKPEALVEFEHAKALVQTMEPTNQAYYLPTVDSRLTAAR